MNLKKKLANPFALVAQGFAGGALLFFASMSLDSDSAPSPQPVQTASAAANPVA